MITLVVIVAVVFAAAGVGLGWLLFHQKDSEEEAGPSNIDMACRIAENLDGKVPARGDSPEWEQSMWTLGPKGHGLRDVTSMGALLGGYAGMESGQDEWAAYGRALAQGAGRLEFSLVSQTYPKLLRACRAR